MTLRHELLARHLRQLAELGVDELYLSSLDRDEAVALLRAPAAHAPGVKIPPAGTDGSPTRPRTPAPDAIAAMDAVRAEALACTRCRLCETRSTVVFGEGSLGARLVVVGEAPGFEEDRSGRPFVGRAGKLLDQLLLSAGFAREDVFICNVLKCRPPDNRNPLPDEVERCAPFLRRQLELIEPKVLLAVGKFAAQTLLGTDESIGGLRRRIHEYRDIPLFATYHPAFLLRSPQHIRTVWQDFQLMRQVLDEQS